MKGRKELPAVELVRALVDYDPETGKFWWRERPEEMFPGRQPAASWNTRFAGKEAFNTQHHAGYLYGALFGSNYSAHRLALYHATGEVPDEADHIDGDRRNNRLSNLRSVSRVDNCRNAKRRAKTSSGVSGVSWDRVNSRWHVRIGRKHIGRFKDFDEAVRVRKAAEVQLDYHPNHGRT